jgi:hypothetical protein
MQASNGWRPQPDEGAEMMARPHLLASRFGSRYDGRALALRIAAREHLHRTSRGCYHPEQVADFRPPYGTTFLTIRPTHPWSRCSRPRLTTQQAWWGAACARVERGMRGTNQPSHRLLTWRMFTVQTLLFHLSVAMREGECTVLVFGQFSLENAIESRDC